MSQAMKLAVGVMLMLFFTPLVIGAIVVILIAAPAYSPEPEFVGAILASSSLVGFFGLLMCIAGFQLVRNNIRECIK